MTIRTRDHDSTDTKLLSTRLLARLGLALAVLVATATAGIGAAAAIPGEAKPPTGVGLSTPAQPVDQTADSKAAPGTVIQSEVVGMNEEYIAVEVQFPQDTFAGEEQFPQDTFERVQNNLIVDRDALANDGLPGLEFPDDIFVGEEQFIPDGNLFERQPVGSGAFSGEEQFPDDLFVGEEQFPDDLFVGEEQFPQDIFAGEEEIPIDSEVIPPDLWDKTSQDDGLSVSDLAYLAPVDKRKAVEDGEMPILTPVAMDFENPHEVTMYFPMDADWPKEYLASDSADGGLGIHMMAPGGWHLLPKPQPAFDAAADTQIPDGTGPILLERPKFDSRPETGTDAIVGDPSTVEGSSGAMPIPQGDIPVPGGMP